MAKQPADFYRVFEGKFAALNFNLWPAKRINNLLEQFPKTTVISVKTAFLWDFFLFKQSK